jgi:hypothetical protein
VSVNQHILTTGAISSGIKTCYCTIQSWWRDPHSSLKRASKQTEEAAMKTLERGFTKKKGETADRMRLLNIS